MTQIAAEENSMGIHLGRVGRRFRCEDRPGKAVLHELRQQAAAVDMGVSKKDGSGADRRETAGS
jgi:hypothetical protein